MRLKDMESIMELLGMCLLCLLQGLLQPLHYDISSAISGHLVLRVRTPVPEYDGFRISFAAGAINPRYSCSGGGQIPFSRGCYKARFQVPAGDEFSEVEIPL